MEQRIAFCTSSDGAHIAYAVLADGADPVVYVAGFPTHLEMEWSKPTARQFIESLAAGLTLIRYDMRGCGLSDTDVTDFSLDALVRDLEAVTDAAAPGRFTLLSLGMLACPTSVAYAAKHPERVSSIVLASGYVRGSGLASAERQAALIDYTEKFGFPVLDYSEKFDPAANVDRTGRDMVQLASSPAVQAQLLRTWFSADVSALLPQITIPATVIHGRYDRLAPFAEGRDLAARLPNAQFVPIEGNTSAAITEQDTTLPMIRRALGAGEPAAAPGSGHVVTVLFTDLVGHAEMMHRLGDAKGRDVLREHERMTRETLKQHGGAEVKSMGDGFMASFTSVNAAMECAITLQRSFAARGADRAASSWADDEPSPLRVRVGLNAGEPIAEDGDLFGSTVILAARIAAQAGAGEILIPEPVRHLLAGKGFVFADHGEFVPKGFDDAVRLYEVHWQV